MNRARRVTWLAAEADEGCNCHDKPAYYMRVSKTSGGSPSPPWTTQTILHKSISGHINDMKVVSAEETGITSRHIHNLRRTLTAP